MAQRLKHRVQIGLETTRGTAVTPTLEVPVKDDGFVATISNAVGEIMASSTFPYTTDQVPVGVTASLTLKGHIHRDNVRDIILMATKRTSGVLPAFTIIDDQYGVGVARYVGCVVSRLAISGSRGGTPDGGSILQFEMSLECMGVANGAGSLASLTQISARSLQLRHGSVLVNNAASTDLVGTSIEIINNLSLGPVNGSNVRLWIEDGPETHNIRHTARFTATTWRAAVEASTAVATNTITLGTGTANETVICSIAAAQIESRNVGDQDGVVTEEISVKPYYSAAAPLVWTYGASTGASVMGL